MKNAILAAFLFSLTLNIQPQSAKAGDTIELRVNLPDGLSKEQVVTDLATARGYRAVLGKNSDGTDIPNPVSAEQFVKESIVHECVEQIAGLSAAKAGDEAKVQVLQSASGVSVK